MFKTLKKIAFERVGGTDEEMKVFDILADEIRGMGIEPVLESFEVATFRAGKGTVELLGNKILSFKANPVGLSGCADITAPARYIEPATLPYAKKDDSIILLQDRVRFEHYKHLVRIGAKGFLLVTPPGKTPGFATLEQKSAREFGKIPGAVISYEAGKRIISAKDARVRMITEQDEFRGTSHNLIVKIPGDIETENIVLCAHADSVASSPGAIDNAAGCVELLGLLEHFAENRPRRNLIFCFFGSEELGLLGSRAFVEKHEDELENINLVINLDLGGDIFGENRAIVTGPKELADYIDSRNKLRGLGLRVSQDIYSSDNMPFAKEGIPAVNLARSGLAASMGHSADDDIHNVDEKSLRSLARIALDFAVEMANAQAFPFERTIPRDIEEKIKKYFRERMGLEDKK